MSNQKQWYIDTVPPQSGRIAVVTGANSGIGYDTTWALAEIGFKVIMACRDLEKGKEAKAAIEKAVSRADLQLLELNLADRKSIAAFTTAISERFTWLDLLINNAGIMMPPYGLTEDGFEQQLATNYLGHFALTGKLLPLLLNSPRSRVVSLSSLSHKWSGIQFDDLHFSNGYSRRKAYGQSKRACLVFAYELQRRLNKIGASTISLAAHPGLSKTNLDRYFPKLLRPLGSLFLQESRMGALPVLYAALGEDLKGGEYTGPGGWREMRGKPVVVDSDSESKDEAIGDRLWKVSQELTGVYYL